MRLNIKHCLYNIACYNLLFTKRCLKTMENITQIDDKETHLYIGVGKTDTENILEMSRVIVSISISIIGLILNGVVIYLTKKHKPLHQPYMYVRAAYAVLDMSTALAMILSTLVIFVLIDNVSSVSCIFTNIIGGQLYAALQLTAYIALERYIYFCRPMKYLQCFHLWSIVIVTISICAITQGYMLITELTIGRNRYPNIQICHLQNQSFHNVVQLLIFVLPAVLCTFYSVYKIMKLISGLKNTSTIHPFFDSNNSEPVIRRKAGIKALR